VRGTDTPLVTARHRLKMFRTETQFVHWLQAQRQAKGQGLRLGIGDDAAVVTLGPGRRELILKADMSIEGVHFARRLHPPRSVGHRALARALSDVAAMGGRPRFALISAALSRRTSRPWLEELYAGLLALARRFGVVIVGGDTAVVPGSTVIDVMLAGEVPRRQALTRSGARPGDRLFVSGRLGMAALGLRLVRSHPRLGLSAAPGRGSRTAAGRAIQAHLYPEPRLALGRWLAEKRLASALIDLSDGLSTDLHHLCQASGVGARLWAERIPGPSPLSSHPTPTRPLTRHDALRLTLHGGEDYELLFAVPRRRLSLMPRQLGGVALSCIGEVRRTKELLLVGPNGKTRPLDPGGYDHFRRLRWRGSDILWQVR